MDDGEFEAAQDVVEHLTALPAMVARLWFNNFPDDLCERAEAVLRLTVRTLDDIGVLTEIEAIEALVKQTKKDRELR